MLRVWVINMENSQQLSLTERQRQVLFWASKGKTSWSIGRILGISENTVLFHMKNIHNLLNVSTRQEAIVKAYRFGLLEAEVG